MAYAAVLGVLIATGACTAARMAALARWPTRGAWVAAMALTVTLPLALPRVGGAPSGPASAPEQAAIQLGDPFPERFEAVPAPPAVAWRTALARVDAWALPLWASASLGVGAYLLLSAAALRRRRRGWHAATVAGEPVLLSEDTGPAVIGVLRPRIVLPQRVLGCDDARQALIVAHEREHLRGRDPALLAAAMLALLVMPWNVALWWQLRRLRLAIETDCDARVLRQGAAARQYAELLLQVGAWPRGVVPMGAGLAEPRSFLERRLQAMTELNPPHRSLRIAALAALLLGAAAVAHALPRPAVPAPLGDPSPARAGPGEAASPPLPSFEPADTPQFTPFEVRPELTNRAAVVQALETAYPPLLRDAGIGGTAQVWIYLDAGGSVQRTRIARSSGHDALDEAAQAVAREMRFSPALNRGQRVAVWIQIPVTFMTRSHAAPDTLRPAAAPSPPSPAPPAPGELRPTRAPAPPAERAAPAAPGELRPTRAPAAPAAPARPGEVRPAAPPAPTFTPFDTRPELLNRAEVARALEQAYPAMLRDAGIGATAQVWIYIDAEGAVSRARVRESSGYPQLDEAAQAVAREMRFAPARHRGEPVAVWIQLPVTFIARAASPAEPMPMR
jgi:TonB family protein